MGCWSADAAGEPELAWRWRRRGRADADRSGGSVGAVDARRAGGGAGADSPAQYRAGGEMGRGDRFTDLSGAPDGRSDEHTSELHQSFASRLPFFVCKKKTSETLYYNYT